MKKDDYFVRVPVSVLMNSDLTRSSVLLYAILIDGADQNGLQYVTVEQLADRCGISPATVRRSERQLVEAELITVQRTGRGSLIGVVGASSMLRQVSGVAAYRAAKRKEA